MVKLAAIDHGYGFLKAVSDSKQVVFPNVISDVVNDVRRDSRPDNDFGSKIQENTLDVTVNHNLGPVQRYFVGQKASLTGKGDLINMDDRLNTPLGRITALTALALLCEDDYTEFIVSTGLPAGHYQSSIKEDYETKFPGDYSVTFNAGPLKGVTRTFKVLAVRVYEQGMGIFFDEVLGDNGDEKAKHPLLEEDLSVNMIIDIGSQTTNYQLFRNRELLTSTSINSGIKLVYDALRAELVPHRYSPSDGDLEYVFKQGVIGDVDLKPAKKMACQDLANRVSNKGHDLVVNNNLRLYMKNVYVGGGGGLAISEHLDFSSFAQEKITVSDAQFSNARGFLKILNLAHRLGKIEVRE